MTNDPSIDVLEERGKLVSNAINELSNMKGCISYKRAWLSNLFICLRKNLASSTDANPRTIVRSPFLETVYKQKHEIEKYGKIKMLSRRVSPANASKRP